MPKPQPGLGGRDPLAAPPRIAPVIATAVTNEDLAPSAPTRKSPASRGRGTGIADERRPDPTARQGPMSMEGGAPKKSYSFYVDPALLEEARDTMVFLSSDPAGPRTLSALIEEGLRREIVRLQDELHHAQPFPPRRVALRRGGNRRDM